MISNLIEKNWVKSKKKVLLIISQLSCGSSFISTTVVKIVKLVKFLCDVLIVFFNQHYHLFSTCWNQVLCYMPSRSLISHTFFCLIWNLSTCWFPEIGSKGFNSNLSEPHGLALSTTSWGLWMPFPSVHLSHSQIVSLPLPPPGNYTPFPSLTKLSSWKSLGHQSLIIQWLSNSMSPLPRSLALAASFLLGKGNASLLVRWPQKSSNKSEDRLGVKYSTQLILN